MAKLKTREANRLLQQLADYASELRIGCEPIFGVSMCGSGPRTLSREERREMHRELHEFFWKWNRRMSAITKNEELYSERKYTQIRQEMDILIKKLEEEPRSVLAKNLVWRAAIKPGHTETCGQLWEFLDEEIPSSKLERSAAILLMHLYALYDWPKNALPWSDVTHEVVRADLLRYFKERDGVEVENIEKARQEGGKQAKRALLEGARRKREKTAKIHEQIKQQAQLLAAHTDPRSIARLLSKKYSKSSRHIRRILNT